MARKLTFITSRISHYMNSNYGNRKMLKQVISCQNGEIKIPEIAQMAYIQGESELNIRFVKYLINKNISNPVSQNNLYQKMIKDHKYIKQCIEQSDVLKYFTIKYSQTNTKQDYQQCCYICYCILIATSINKDDYLHDVLTLDFYKHFLPMLYTASKNTNDIKYLSKSISLSLGKQWNYKVQIKESYKVEKDSVNFKLLAIVEKHKPYELIEIIGKRLKESRTKAYTSLITRINEGLFKFELP